MRKSVLIFAIIAIGLAGGTVYFVQQWLKAERAAMTSRSTPTSVAKRPAKKTFVLIAARPLPAGSFLKAGDARWQSWPDAQVPAQYVRVTAAAAPNTIPKGLDGSVVRRGIAAGQPIVKEFIVRKGEHGFLAAVLTPGMRAVSINVDDATGISGLVFPGDRVDVILTHQTTTKVGTQKVHNKVSETIIVNVRVLAIDQQTNDLAGKPKRAKTVTLEVTPHQAEVIAVATRMGSLTLSLRSLAHGVAKTATDGKTASRTTDANHDLASNCVPGTVGCKESMPRRGRTFTTDRDFSVYMSRQQKTSQSINVIRGDKVQSVNPDTGVEPSATNKGAKKTPAKTTTNTIGE